MGRKNSCCKVEPPPSPPPLASSRERDGTSTQKNKLAAPAVLRPITDSHVLGVRVAAAAAIRTHQPVMFSFIELEYVVFSCGQRYNITTKLTDETVTKLARNNFTT